MPVRVHTRPGVVTAFDADDGQCVNVPSGIGAIALKERGNKKNLKTEATRGESRSCAPRENEAEGCTKENPGGEERGESQFVIVSLSVGRGGGLFLVFLFPTSLPTIDQFFLNSL